jgi:hypothetical protein
MNPSPTGLSNVDLVLGVLGQLGLPMSSAEIATMLEAAGDGLSVDQVVEALAGAGGDRVVTVDDDKWQIAVGALDLDQRRVVDASPADRMLVIAGPGAGKTEVACARVAAARAAGIPARAILMVSFTRAATAEVRGRLDRLAESRGVTARGVEIRTLDSLAWTLQRHLGDADLLTGSYSDNIERMLELLDSTPAELREHLSSLRLLVLDEAQDIVGRRSDLALALIGALPPTAGITVFADPAQAIYGDWALDEGTHMEDSPPVHERIERGDAGAFRLEQLRGSHRTSNPELRRISEGLREYVLVRSIAEDAAYAHVRSELARHGEPAATKAPALAGLARSDISQFFLFRTHGEVVQLSSYLSSGGVRHRLRFPGLPRVVSPWIGRLLYLGADRKLRRPEFDRMWTDRVGGTQFDVISPDEGWATLVAVAGDEALGHVDVIHLREILSRRNPPDEVLSAALGTAGPILGTIHGSKGREADEVILALGQPQEGGDQREEARVLYVGATRARESLRTAEVSSREFYLPSRRAWRQVAGGSPRAQVEFGLEGDVDPVSPVSSRLGSDAQALARQDALAIATNSDPAARWDTERPVKATDDWERIIRVEGGPTIAFCGPAFTRDLWELTNRFRRSGLRPPDRQQHLYVVDHTTVARDEDSADLNRLTGTFARSGFWVAPVLKGFSMVYPRWRS